MGVGIKRPIFRSAEFARADVNNDVRNIYVSRIPWPGDGLLTGDRITAGLQQGFQDINQTIDGSVLTEPAARIELGRIHISYRCVGFPQEFDLVLSPERGRDLQRYLEHSIENYKPFNATPIGKVSCKSAVELVVRVMLDILNNAIAQALAAPLAVLGAAFAQQVTVSVNRVEYPFTGDERTMALSIYVGLPGRLYGVAAAGAPMTVGASASPAVVGWQPSVQDRQRRSDVIMRGIDGRMYQTWSGDGKWAKWGAFMGSGRFMTGATAASWGPGRLDVFALGEDGRIWQSFWDAGRWSGWAATLGDLRSRFAPAAISRAVGTLDVFAVGLDGQMVRIAWNGETWFKRPASLPEGTFRSAPAAVSWNEQRMDVFALGEDRRLYQATWLDGKWHGWQNNFGAATFTSAPCAVTRAPNRFDLFARGEDRQIYHAFWDGSHWRGWATDVGTGTFRSGPAAVSQSANHIEVYAVGDDNRLWRTVWQGKVWSGWMADMGGESFA
jgi:hypothetical protein